MGLRCGVAALLHFSLYIDAIFVNKVTYYLRRKNFGRVFDSLALQVHGIRFQPAAERVPRHARCVGQFGFRHRFHNACSASSQSCFCVSLEPSACIRATMRALLENSSHAAFCAGVGGALNLGHRCTKVFPLKVRK